MGYATINRKTFNKVANASQSMNQDLLGNAQVVSPDSPAVLKIRDANQREIFN